jgi:hypothetical protein
MRARPLPLIPPRGLQAVVGRRRIAVCWRVALPDRDASSKAVLGGGVVVSVLAVAREPGGDAAAERLLGRVLLWVRGRLGLIRAPTLLNARRVLRGGRELSACEAGLRRLVE